MIREAIIRKIVERDVAGESLREEDVRRDDELLHAAAIDDFAAWETALEYAGVDTRPSRLGRGGDRRVLTKSRVQQRLRRLCTTGYDLGAKLNRSRNRQLYDAALRYHGSWRAALTAAGINLANVSRRRPDHFDRETMILWLRQRQAAGQTLAYTEVCLQYRDKALAIRRRFRSWKKALEAAGLADPD